MSLEVRSHSDRGVQPTRATLASRFLSFLVNLKHGRFVRRGKYHTPEGPRLLQVEATNACNLSCPFCARTTVMKRKIGFLEPALFRNIAAQGVAAGAKACHFAVFGEPLLHPEIDVLVRIAKEAGLSWVWISSNGSFLTRDKVEKLCAAGLDELHVCVDGADRMTHEALRAGSCYDNVLAQMEDCAQYLRAQPAKAFRLHVQMIVMQKNSHQKNEFVARWKKILRGTKHNAKFLKQYTNFAGQTRFPSPSLGASIRYQVPCFRLAEEIAVMWDGTVCACCYDADASMPVGDMRQGTLKEIWRGAPLTRMREQHAQGRYDALPLCKQCDVVNRHFSITR